MTTRDSFGKNFLLVLKALAPFIILMVVGFAAAFSNGSWSVFFLMSLPITAAVGLVLWLALSVTAAVVRYKNGVSVGGNGNGGGGDDDFGSRDYSGRDINPATGFQTVGGFGSQDVAGNAWGENNNY